MKRRKIRQRGYALITAMAIGVVGLTITSVVMLRMMNSTGQITQRERTDQAVFLAESVANHVVDKIADLTADPDLGGADTPGIYTPAADIMEMLHGTGNDFMDLAANTSGDIVFSRPESLPTGYFEQRYNMTSNAQAFFDSLGTDTNHSKIFWEHFQASNENPATGTVSSLLTDSAKIQQTLNELHQNFYSIYHVEKGSQQADVQISVVPLATDVEGTDEAKLHDPDTFSPHHDVFKIQVTSYIPDINNPRTQKTIDIIVNRPVLQGIPIPFPDKAILTDGDLDIDKGETYAGDCSAMPTTKGGMSPNAACIDDEVGGDIHANGDLIIAGAGNVRGRATATGTVTAGGEELDASDFDPDNPDERAATNNNGITQTIRDSEQSRSGAKKIEIPKVDDDVSHITTPCDTSKTRLKDCYIQPSANGFDGNGHEFEGTVHIRGDYTLGGNGQAGCKGSIPCRLVIDGGVKFTGTPSYNHNSDQESLYIVKGQSATGPSVQKNCIQISGTPDPIGQRGILFYVDNPFCETTMSGTYNFFGSIISKGSFRNNGNATTIGVQYATNMTVGDYYNKPTPAKKPDLFPKVVAWKNRN